MSQTPQFLNQLDSRHFFCVRFEFEAIVAKNVLAVSGQSFCNG